MDILDRISDKLVSIIGTRKHINKEELETLREVYGAETGDKIYALAGRGSRVSKAEMATIVKLIAETEQKKLQEAAAVTRRVIEVSTAVEEVKKEMISKLDILQNEKIAWLTTQIGQIRTNELGYLGEQIHNTREAEKVLSSDIIGIVERLQVLEAKAGIKR